MAEILINAEEVRSCVKYKSGKVCIWLDGVKEIREVPAHGRLINEADLRDRAYKRQIRDRISFNDALVLALMDAPTVIEASEGRKK